MKKWLISAVTAGSIALASWSQPLLADNKDPYQLINQVATTTFARLKKDTARYQANPELLREVAKQEVLPHINVRYAALRVLGPLAEKSSKEERELFNAAFSNYLVAAYAQILTEYTDQKVTVEKAKPIPADRNVVSVRVDITDAARAPIRLDFKLRKNSKTNEWQGYDVQAEGVSMLETKISEWQGELRKKGIKAVAKQLDDQAKQPIQKKSK
ncbi:MAG: ABC transporter substrate-binding protein [Vibrionaceae bacterium]